MTSAADNAAGKQRGRPFARGQSGNPTGRPRGLRNKVTVAVEGLMGQYAQQVKLRRGSSSVRPKATWSPPASF
jgi:hypothetical protein